jgi:hypothetical protein
MKRIQQRAQGQIALPQAQQIDQHIVDNATVQ